MTDTVLISGATGFIAGHTIKELLREGYRVIASCRNPDDASATQHLTALPGAAERLELFKADLTTPNVFDPFAERADYILHMASPFIVSVKDPENDLVKPAISGTETMLSAAVKSPRVRRVIVTSSMAAITDEPDNDRVLSENDWNEKSSLKRNPYYYSKVMAERAAWDFYKAHNPSWALVTINPFLVIGPAMTSKLNESPKVLVDMLNGAYPAIMSLAWGFVDVRDVAHAHVKALDASNANGRYLCSAETRSMREVVDLLRNNGYAQTKLPKLSFESSLGRKISYLASYTQPKGVDTYLRSHLGRIPRYDNSKIQRDLDISFRPVDQSILETCEDAVKWGHVKTLREAS